MAHKSSAFGCTMRAGILLTCMWRTACTLPSMMCCVVTVVYSGAEVCCADIGCFTNAAPFATFPLPMCPAELKPALNYRMYTRSNRVVGQNFDHKGSIP